MRALNEGDRVLEVSFSSGQAHQADCLVWQLITTPCDIEAIAWFRIRSGEPATRKICEP